MDEYRSGQNRKDLLKELVKTNFKLRYNNSLLGFLWVLMKPFFNFLILFIVFTAFRGGNTGPNYGANLLLGIIIFTFIQEGVILGMKSLLGNARIILKVNFPRQLAITSALLNSLINLGINVFVFITITVFASFSPNLLGLLYVIAIIALLFFGTYSIALFTSILLVKVRDLDHIMELVMQLLFWGSGVFYNINDIDGRFGTIIMLNPAALLIDAARQALIYGKFAHLEQFVVLWILAIIVYLLGKRYFNNNIKKIAEFF
ncbi:ABC transporter permease [Candidatus Dojkabacteria bacterium]|uniref:Transport permease protein n=1 Tax=Candidatus Dojkabacteria bacterium TaxID=2099670 RepID=A0A955RJK4_9BACT|nr:ABC transporter permease [Candidatus Dojkabacteria bacterium]